MAQFDKYVEELNDYKEQPHVIDVIVPMLCSYLPTWWNHGPDNADPKGGSHITMITSENLNGFLKIVLKLVMKNVGVAEAEWLSRIAMISSQIIINTSEELLKDYLPLTEKIRTSVTKMYEKEEVRLNHSKYFQQKYSQNIFIARTSEATSRLLLTTPLRSRVRSRRSGT